MNSAHSNRHTRPQSVFTVSELNRRIKQILEKSFACIWFVGEISNLRQPPSGHLYFALKDDQSQLAAVMFKGQARRLRARLEDGLSILGMGRVSVYEPRGGYQVIVEYLEPKGLGDLQLAFEQLKQKLADEGLFEPGPKKTPPPLPRKIHVITSPSGAVIYDIVSVVQRRFANIPIVLIPTAVQGLRSADEIVEAIEILNRLPDAEIAILARGGGSLEDLQAFNDERVARAIYRSQVPMISAVGHETDYTITDFVADLRAPTPSAAAELVVPDRGALAEKIEATRHHLTLAMYAAMAFKRNQLNDFAGRLADPRRRITDGRLRLDDLTQRVAISIQRTLRDYRRGLTLRLTRLEKNPFRDQIKLVKQNNKELENKLLNIMLNIKNLNKWRLHDLTSRLNALNPKSVLERGYSITRVLPQRTVVRDAHQVGLNDSVEITLASGILQCRIEGKEDDGC